MGKFKRFCPKCREELLTQVAYHPQSYLVVAVRFVCPKCDWAGTDYEVPPVYIPDGGETSISVDCGME